MPRLSVTMHRTVAAVPVSAFVVAVLSTAATVSPSYCTEKPTMVALKFPLALLGSKVIFTLEYPTTQALMPGIRLLSRSALIHPSVTVGAAPSGGYSVSRAVAVPLLVLP